MVTLMVSNISQWYAHEYVNECITLLISLAMILAMVALSFNDYTGKFFDEYEVSLFCWETFFNYFKCNWQKVKTIVKTVSIPLLK